MVIILQATLTATRVLIHIILTGALHGHLLHQATAEAIHNRSIVDLDLITKVMFAQMKACQEELRTCYVLKKIMIDKTLVIFPSQTLVKVIMLKQVL